MRWVGDHVAMPDCPYVLVEHEDQEPGLLAKLGPAYALADQVYDAGGDVLFHCHQGASRSAAALTGWQVHGRGVPLDDVMEAILSTRPATAHFWPGWLPELRQPVESVRTFLTYP